jgi:hypothetical protein
LTGSFRSRTLEEAYTKLFLVRHLLSNFKPGTKIPREEVIFALERFSAFFPEPTVYELIESTGIVQFSKDDNTYMIKQKVSLGDLYEDVLPLEECNINTYIDLFNRISLGKVPEDASYGNFLSLANVLKDSYEFAIKATESCKNDRLRGVTTFFTYDEDKLLPLGLNSSSFSTFDAINLMLEPMLYEFDLSGLKNPQGLQLLETTWEWSKNLVNRTKGWNYGGIFVGEDYPSAEFPVIESTAIGVLSFSLLWKFLHSLSTFESVNVQTNQTEIREYIIDALEFLIRLQNLDGSWGVYRYPSKLEGPEPPPHDFSCQQSLIALANGLSIGNFSVELNDKARKSVENCVDFLLRTSERENDSLFWKGDFFMDQNKEMVATTIRLLQALMIASFRWKDLIPRIIEPLKHGRNFILRHWEPSASNISVSYVRAPKKEGLAATFTTLETPIDPLAVSFLLESSRELELEIDSSAWNKIEKAIFRFVRSQNQGSWPNPDPDPTKQWPFLSHTYFYRRALMLYVWFVRPKIPGLREMIHSNF